MGLLSVGGQLLFTSGMGFTSATAGSATTQLVPVLAWGLGLVVLDEPLRPLSALGALLCITGVLLGAVRQPGPRRHDNASPAAGEAHPKKL
jgi:drug/metabolite transporter (DMT)-like permease